jgi:hypothetical protein
MKEFYLKKKHFKNWLEEWSLFMVEPWEITIEQAKREADELRKRRKAADREDAYLFAQQLAEDLAEEVKIEERKNKIREKITLLGLEEINSTLGNLFRKIQKNLLDTYGKENIDSAHLGVAQCKWSENVARAAGQTWTWEDSKIKIGEFTFLITGGTSRTQKGISTTTLFLKQERGSRYPVPKVDIYLINKNGNFLKPSNAPPFKPGSKIEIKHEGLPTEISWILLSLRIIK